MRKFLLMGFSVVAVACAAILAAKQPGTPSSDQAGFLVTKEDKNPWTHLNPNVADDQFQFAIVSDRTGGHRKGVFSKAVQKINLMQPEFVMSVGDLIEGSPVAETNTTQWKEFEGYINQFQMPFFMCGGNHDIASKVKIDVWKERFGRSYYHFLYKNCLFLVMNSYDGEGLEGNPRAHTDRIGPKQIEYVKKALEDNKGVRWTFVFMHSPIWNSPKVDTNGFATVEKILQANDRKYSAYCGHLHVYRKYIRNGYNYYQLATTGGSSSMRGLDYGEFDQIAWITMGKNGPVMANVDLGGVLKEDLSEFQSTEDGKIVMPAKGSVPVHGKCTLDGKPAYGLEVVFVAESGANAGMGRVTADGSFSIYPNRGGDGIKPGKYVAIVRPATSFVIDPKAVITNPVPELYRTSAKSPFSLAVTADGKNEFVLEMVSPKE